MNRHRNVSSTSTSTNRSNRPREWPGRIAKEYGTRPKVVWWWPNEIWRLVEGNLSIPQEQQSSCSQQKDYSSTSLTQRGHSRNLCIEEDQQTRRHWWYPELGRVCRRNQDSIQQQEQSSRCRMENRNIQAEKETHCGFHNWILSVGYESRHRWLTRHILIKEECLTWHYQDNIGLSIYSNAWNTQGVESSNHISRTRIRIHRRETWLQD